MTTPDLENLGNRVHALEIQNRRLKRIGLLAATVVCVGFAMGAAQTSRTVEAEAFVLKDSTGKVRARMTSIQNNTHLTFFDANEKNRMTFGIVQDSPSLVLIDENGTGRTIIRLSNEGMGRITFFGPDGKTPHAVMADSTSGPALRLYDSKGSDRAAVSIRRDKPFIHFTDANGKIRSVLGEAGEGGIHGLVFYDANGTRVHQTP